MEVIRRGIVEIGQKVNIKEKLPMPAVPQWEAEEAPRQLRVTVSLPSTQRTVVDRQRTLAKNLRIPRELL